MPSLAALLLSAFQQIQDDPARQARELVEKLRSDKIDEREDAEKKLKELGRAALPELEKAARSGDRELAERSRHLLKVIPIRLRLTPKVLARFPGIAERLASSDDHTWTLVFLEIAEQAAPEEAPPDVEGKANPRIVTLWKEKDEKTATMTFQGEDLRSLLPTAVRGAATDEERSSVFEKIRRRSLYSCAPELLAMARDPNAAIRGGSLEALSALRAKGSVVELRRALQDPEAQVRTSAVQGLGQVGGKELLPDLVAMLDDASPKVRVAALYALNSRQAREAAAGIAKRLADPDESVRANAAFVLGFLDARETAPALMKLLSDPEIHVRNYAVQSLGRLKVRETGPEVAKLLHDSSKDVRQCAIVSLSAILGKESIPELEKALDDGDNQVQITAIQELGIQDARESIPKLVGLLKNESEMVRHWSARQLCAWGAREGIPILLAQNVDLVLLNRFRRPKVWDRLESTPFRGSPQGSLKEVIAHALQESGLRADWPKDDSGNDVSWASDPCSAYNVGSSALSVLVAVVHARNYELLLEEDQVRLLPRKEAHALWKVWWTDEERKK
jgi:HEAT repeat protein